MILQGKRIFIAGQFMPAQIKISGEKIETILSYGSEKADVDYGNAMVLPGFIDIHTHGGYGYMTDLPTAQGMDTWIERLPEEGVTSFLPTTSTNPMDEIKVTLENIANVKDKAPRGAQILGIHLEGPFLDHSYRGAHDAKLLRMPSISDFEELQKSARGNIRYMTLACEHDNNFALTRHASSRGVVVAVGHSGGCAEATLLALANGASSFTHSFNGMRGLHHREPGIVGALMTSTTYAELIADGEHVHPLVINLLFKAKNNSGIILITDSMVAKGLSPGVYASDGMQIQVDDSGTARILGTDTLVGSSLRINLGLKLLVTEAMVSMEHAILSATLNPAQALGLERQKGQLLAGADADLAILADDWSVVQTYCLGQAMLS